MVFKRLRDAFGAGAPSIVVILNTPRTQPGGMLSGEARLKGGEFDAALDRIGLGLITFPGPALTEGEEFAQTRISGPLVVRQGEERAFEFQVAVPWETPISEIGGRHLPGMALGVRAEVATTTVVDQADPDLVAVRPLPSQSRVLQAFARLGFPFKAAALQTGGPDSGHRELPFHQKIEFFPPSHHTGIVHGIELAFVPSFDGLDVVLEADQLGGRLSSGAQRFRLTHEEALRTDWPSVIDRWLAGLAHHVRGVDRGPGRGRPVT
ncbi:sporulation protein [Nonomuraea antimicrobica]|uniref:Sporulation protein n=1 Tax=Nonomuraea antimicrobica TaxID=561173 RepID=A0ABP7BS60_9ACTN